MKTIFGLLMCCLLMGRGRALQAGLNHAEEPQCNSRFDFELKVVESIASLKASEKNLRETVATLQETVNTLQETIRDKPQTVAFMAELSSNMVIEPRGEVHMPIVFDKVHANAGTAYNKYTGVFTAPYNGSYYFGMDISSPPTSDAHLLHIHLYRNDIRIGYVFLEKNTVYWLRRSMGLTVMLEVHDSVRAIVTKSTGSKANTVAGNYFHSHLSGFFIGPDL